jgi:hypothetical protein
MSEQQVLEKFRGMFAGRGSATQCELVLERMRSLETVDDVGRDVLAPLAA